jgi:hypothetical protein
MAPLALAAAAPRWPGGTESESNAAPPRRSSELEGLPGGPGWFRTSPSVPATVPVPPHIERAPAASAGRRLPTRIQLALVTVVRSEPERSCETASCTLT